MKLVLLFLLLLLPALCLESCDCATHPVPKETIAIVEFEIEEPTAQTGAAAFTVVTGTTIRLRWKIEGPVQRILLAAGDQILAELGPEGREISFTDSCEDNVCGTQQPKERVLYSLLAFGEGDNTISATRSLAISVTQGP